MGNRVLRALAYLMVMALTSPLSLAHAQAAPKVTEDAAYEIGVEAYTYLYPLVLMDVTRRQAVNVEPEKTLGRAPMNMFAHFRAFPPAEFRDVVRPNFDTLYSTAWLDLIKEPVMVSVPDTQGRYYMLPMLDMWTDVFAVPGKRTTGTHAGRFAIVPPGWKGTLPKDVQRIDAPTPYVWIIGRTQTKGANDYAAVNRMQDGYTITPLSQLGKAPKPVKVMIDPTVDMKTPPMTQVANMSAGQFFSYAVALLKVNPPHVTDQPIISRMRVLGIEPGTPFDFQKADPAVQHGLERAAPDALQAMRVKMPTLARTVNGWQMITDLGVYGNNYLKRAAIALFGLGANPPEDAIYPVNIGDSDGKPLTGANRYVLHFAKNEIPPVTAFWSVTLYDQEGFPTATALKRNAIGDRDALMFNPDGSLDIYVQHASPGADKESNWLPAPAGDFNLLMRLYGPKVSVIDGSWAPPAVKRLSAATSTTAWPAAFADGAEARLMRFDNTHQARFIEIFLADHEPATGNIIAAVYNTLFTSEGVPDSKDSAPQAMVERLDFEKMKEEYGVLAASLNGPKLWLTDWIEVDVGKERDFNGLKAAWVAQLNLGKSANPESSAPYNRTTINRKSALGWNKGTTVMLLDDPNGTTWILKGFQLGLKPQETYQEFMAAGASNYKKLPKGWKVRVKTLEKDLIETPEGGVATIMSDEFFNVYDKTGPGMSNYKP